MNPALIEPVLELILDLLGKTVTNAEVDRVIAIIEAWLPVIVQTFPNLYQKVQDIVSLLKGNAILTQDQIDRIDAMNVSSDANFDAALDQALKEV